MESLCKTVLTFTILTLFLLLTDATSTLASSTASENCSEKCGNMTISYPFGIKDGCFRDGFQINCNKKTGTASTIDGVEIIDISLSQAQMRIYNWIGFSCNHPKGRDNVSYSSYVGMSDTRYRFSHTLNKFTAVGCQTLAIIVDPFTQSNYYTTKYSDIFATGCLSLCTNQSKFQNNSTYSGGCCQATVPEGLSRYKIIFDRGFLNNAIWDYSPCSYAFIAEDGFYSFHQSDIEHGNLYRRFDQAPVVLDWVIGNETCEEAKLNKSGNHACVSLNSTCKDSQNGPGYTCTCSQGYEGNPYIHDGCTDVDECKTQTMPSPCYGDCNNIPGSYQCLCPKGTYGNASIEGNCTPPSSHKLTTTQIVTITTV